MTVNEKEFLCSSISRMLRSASLREMRIVYEFALHLIEGKEVSSHDEQ